MNEKLHGWRSVENATYCGPVLFLVSASYVVGLNCLFVLSLASRVFLQVLRFSSLRKNQHFQKGKGPSKYMDSSTNKI
jgi:hypothetical protein